MATETANLSPLELRAAITPKSIDNENRTFEVVFATDTPYLRNGWSGGYFEILSFDKKSHIRQDRLKNGVAFLDSHDRYSGVRAVMGTTTAYEIDTEKKQGRATVKFSKAPEWDSVWKNIEDGILKDISVGYRVYKMEEQPAPNPKDPPKYPTYRVTDWEPQEISLVSIPADPNSKIRSVEVEPNEVEVVRLEAPPIALEVNINSKSNNNMPNPNDTPPVITDEQRKAIEQEAAINERKRANSILETCKKAGLGADFAQRFIDDSSDLNKVREAIIDHLAEQDEKRAQNNAVSTSKGGEDLERKGIELAMIARHDSNVKLEGKAADYRYYKAMDFAKLALKRAGVTGVDAMAPSSIFSRVMSTSDFPELLGNSLNHFMQLGYNMAGTDDWKKLARRKAMSDFRSQTGIQVGGSIMPDEIPEGGEYPEKVLGESEESIKLKTWGNKLSFTRQALINDDLGAFMDISQRLGASHARKQASLAWAVLTSNSGVGQTMAYDSQPLFHSSHSNIGTTGAISITSLGEARALLQKQTGFDTNEKLNLTPVYLVVSPDKLTLAEQFVAQITPEQASNVNPFRFLQVISSPYLSGNRWYITASPMQVDMLIYAELDGTNGIFMEMERNFNTDAVDYKARTDFQVRAFDHRGFVTNAGA